MEVILSYIREAKHQIYAALHDVPILGDLMIHAYSFVLKPFSPESRIFWVYIVSSFAMAIIPYVLYYRNRTNSPYKSFLAYCFPKEVYLHPSAIVDYKIWIVGQILRPMSIAFRALTVAGIATGTVWALTSVFGELDLLEWNWTTGLVFSIAYFVVVDFAAYVEHPMFHHHPFLWEIHRVHHSAEVMMPLTVSRVHFLEGLIFEPLQRLCAGGLQGLFMYVCAGEVEFVTLLGINAVIVLFNLAGANLRHSHIWIHYGHAISHILISPAQHQIHHSVERKHWGRNYGVSLAIWDWMFGTLYVPKGREEIRFGIAENVPQPHTTLVGAYWLPLVGMWRIAARRFGRSPVVAEPEPMVAAAAPSSTWGPP